MSDEAGRFELTRRRLLGGVAASGVAAAGAGAGTMAYLQDTEESTDNSVQAGTMDLDIHDSESLQWEVLGATPGGPENETQDIVMEHTGTVPADHLELDFENVEIEDDDGKPKDDSGNWALDSGPESDPETGSSSTDGNQDSGADGMAKYVRVEEMFYDEDTTDGSSSNRLYLVSNGQPQPVSGHTLTEEDTSIDAISLYDLAHSNNEDALDGFRPPEPGSTAGDGNDSVRDTKLQINVRLDSKTPNRYQGDAVVTTVTASLHQDSSQNS